MTEKLYRIFPYLLLVPAILPLVYISGVVYPYVAPKTFLLQGLGITALALFVYLAFSGHSFFYGRLRNWFTWIPGALLVVAYASSLFGVDFYRSFWGLLDRGDGLLTLTVITVLFYLILLSADRIFLERLVKTVAIVAGIVAVIAVLQWMVIAFGGRAQFLPPVFGRIGSTFGNAAFLAGYLGMALFAVLLSLRDADGIRLRIFQAMAVLCVLAILFAATRGTILALMAAFVVALAYIAWKANGKTRRLAGYGLIAVIILIGSFFVFRSELSQSSFEPISRMASISFSDSTVASRLFVWQNIGEEALKRPLQGYGAESVASIFNRVYDPSKIVEPWFDRSHNAFLDYFVQYGIFGLLLYLLLIGAFFVSALRIYKREPFELLNVGFLLALFIFIYAVQNFFVFDTPSSLWLLYAFFAMSIILLSDVQKTKLSIRFPFLAPILAVIIFIAIVPSVAFPLYANILLSRGYLYHLTDVSRANAYFKRGLSLNTYADLEYGYQAYSMYTDRQAIHLSGQSRIDAYKYALSILTANFKKYPYDARTATYLGHVMDAAPPEVEVDIDFNREVLERAIELSPMRAQAWYMTVNIYLEQANAPTVDQKTREHYYREAIALLESYVEKVPGIAASRFMLSNLYYAVGDKETAKKWADSALPLYKSEDGVSAREAVKYYLAVGDWQTAVRFLTDLVNENPDDYNILYDLAKATYLAGDVDASLRIVEKIRAENPALLETDQNFLDTIRNYEQSKRQ